MRRRKMKKLLNVKIKKVRSTAIAPMRGSDQAAGYDLHADRDVEIPPHETVMLKSGLSMEIPDGLFGLVCSRSGLSTKYGLRLANGVGVIDSDYRGEICMPIYNDSSVPRYIKEGDRVAQIIFVPHIAAEFILKDDLEDTGRGKKGFGSTGK